MLRSKFEECDRVTDVFQGDGGQRIGSLDSLNKVASTDDGKSLKKRPTRIDGVDCERLFLGVLGCSAPLPPVRGWRPVRPPASAPPQRPPRTRHLYNRL